MFRENPRNLKLETLKPLLHTSRTIGTHKNYIRLVDCPIYSVVKHRPHQLALITRLSGLSCFQPNVRHQVTCAPNIRLTNYYFKEIATNKKATPKRANTSLPSQFGMIGPVARLRQRKSSDRPNRLTAKKKTANSPKKIRSFISVQRKSGGADRDRTGGLLVANQALSQLSYSPFPQ